MRHSNVCIRVYGPHMGWQSIRRPAGWIWSLYFLCIHLRSGRCRWPFFHMFYPSAIRQKAGIITVSYIMCPSPTKEGAFCFLNPTRPEYGSVCHIHIKSGKNIHFFFNVIFFVSRTNHSNRFIKFGTVCPFTDFKPVRPSKQWPWCFTHKCSFVLTFCF